MSSGEVESIITTVVQQPLKLRYTSDELSLPALNICTNPPSPTTVDTPTMSYSTSIPTYTFFASSPASPNAFALFGSMQSPRDTYNLYEDARQVLGSSNGRTSQLKATKSGLKKYFGL